MEGRSPEDAGGRAGAAKDGSIMNMEKIELLLMHAEEERPVLEDGLPFDAASGAAKPH
jgi:hypothetical protein